MLFQRRFHQGLRDGSIDLTFRRWSTPKVRLGGRYRFGGSGVLEVVALDRVRLRDVTPREARRSGFESTEALGRELARTGGSAPTAGTWLTRVRFRYCGEETPPEVDPRATPSPEDVAAAVERLAAMERRSRREPWITTVLAWIERNPQRRSGDLADEISQDRAKLKSDVRRLKQLGLLRSFEVGYELTPLGRAVLEPRRREQGELEQRDEPR